MTSLTQTAAAIDALNTAAGALIAKAQSDAAALATAQADIANADADTAQKVAVVTQAINAVLPQSSGSAPPIRPSHRPPDVPPAPGIPRRRNRERPPMALILDLLAKLRPVLARFWPHILSAALALAAWHFWTRAVANAETVRTQAAQFTQAQADAAKIAQEALHHQEAEYQAKATETRMHTRFNWPTRMRLLIGISLLTALLLCLPACAPRPLKVMPAQPLPVPKVAVPPFLQACPPTPSWYPPTTCRPAPTR
jgi:hypothetical protein